MGDLQDIIDRVNRRKKGSLPSDARESAADIAARESSDPSPAATTEPKTDKRLEDPEYRKSLERFGPDVADGQAQLKAGLTSSDPFERQASELLHGQIEGGKKIGKLETAITAGMLIPVAGATTALGQVAAAAGHGAIANTATQVASDVGDGTPAGQTVRNALDASGSGAATGAVANVATQALGAMANPMLDAATRPGAGNSLTDPIKKVPTALAGAAGTAAAMAGAGPVGGTVIAGAMKAAPYAARTLRIGKDLSTYALADFTDAVAKGAPIEEPMRAALAAGLPKAMLDSIKGLRQTPVKVGDE